MTAGAVQSPRISVLLPARDAEATLAAALASVARQTRPDFECVVVDDGSRDATGRIAADFARRDPRFRVLARSRQGLVSALEAGLADCRAEYVARMDADDLMHRERLAAQCRLLDRRPELDAAGCHVRIFPRAGLREGRRSYEDWLNAIDSPRRVREEAFVECPVAHPTLFARRALLERHRYRDRGWPEDYDLILRILASGGRIGVVPRRLLLWRDRPGRLSRTDSRYALSAFTACKARFLAGGLLARSCAYVLWGYGATGKAMRKALLAHERRPSHIVELHPGRLGETIHGAPVIAPEALGGLPRHPVVAAVAGAPARREIRAVLTGFGYAELRDFVCVA